jgi:hypothetical protein
MKTTFKFSKYLQNKQVIPFCLFAMNMSENQGIYYKRTGEGLPPDPGSNT